MSFKAKFRSEAAAMVSSCGAVCEVAGIDPAISHVSTAILSRTFTSLIFRFMLFNLYRDLWVGGNAGVGAERYSLLSRIALKAQPLRAADGAGGAELDGGLF